MNTDYDNLLITRRSSFAILCDFFRVALYQKITRNALPLFVRGRDVISAGPMAIGSHEPHVTAMLECFASQGFNNFLVDIGANIGLTTCLVGKYFDEVVLFEPNPLCLGILETNVAVSLSNTPYQIHRYGLGRSNEKLNLRVPHLNWGGAYVVSDDNMYSKETLLAKDGFVNDDSKNYLSIEIDIRDSKIILRDLFEELRVAGKLNGSVKIDVEGFELVVLQAIAATLPPEMRLSIIFENWSGDFPGEDVQSFFKSRAKLFNLAKTPKVNGSRWRKLLALLIAGNEKYSLIPWKPGSISNDLVLKVNSSN